MGASESSNVAEAITNITNSVSNSTSVTADQQQDLVNNISMGSGCTIQLSGDYNVHTSAKLMAQNNQIVQAKQDANLNNNVAQQIAQTATSTSGAGGIGYASAHNSSSTLVNASSEIMNAMTVGCSQYSSINNNFSCTGSTIKAANLNIDFGSSTEFMSKQTLDNSQVASVVNSVTQSATQTATATVQGIAGLIFQIVLGLGVIAYVAAKPLSSPAGKSIVGVGAIFGIVVTTTLMFLAATPPFFNEPAECINHSSIGMGADPNTGITPECINQTERKINLTQPPLKYIYGITPSNNSQPGANLMQMAISTQSGHNAPGSSFGPNGGYNGETWSKINSLLPSYNALALKLNIPNIPNPLYMPSPQTDNDYKLTDNPNKYYVIPSSYLQTNQQVTTFSCTPGTIQVGRGTDTQILTGDKDHPSCPSKAAPNAWNATSWGIPATTNITNDSVANLNTRDWDAYLNMQLNSDKYKPTVPWINEEINESEARSLFARFVLCDLIGLFDLHYYINKNEPVKISTVPQLAKEVTNQSDIYFYHPNSTPGTWSNGFTGSGYLSGRVGVINNTQYKFHSFMQNYGGLTLVGIFLVLILFLVFVKKSEKPPSGIGTPASKVS
jgi:hypothetical protein